MRYLGKLVALTAVALAFAAPTAAQADPGIQANLVDGTITVPNTTDCAWTNGSTTADPPSPLSILRSTINPTGGNLSCTNGYAVRLLNDPSATFDDVAGTSTIATLDFSATTAGITCSYRATNIVMTRSGTTRTYSVSALSAVKIGGGFLCPGSVSGGSATVSYH